MSTEHDELLVAAAGGESRAFAQLAEPYWAELRRFATRMVGGDEGLGEEVTQEALLRAYQSIRSGARPHNVRAWLYTIARNYALNAVRGRRPAVPLSEGDYDNAAVTPAREVELREWMDWLVTAIGALPPRQRDALVAYAFEGRSQQEIAGSMGTSVPAIKTLLYRARRTLQAAQPSSLAALPLAALALARRARSHARSIVVAKVGTKGAAAAGWQLLVAATVATSVAIVAHGGVGPVIASALTPSGGVAAPPARPRHRASHHAGKTPGSTAVKVGREGRHALRECLTGKRLSRDLSGAGLRYAERHMSDADREYTECEQVLRNAQLRRAATRPPAHQPAAGRSRQPGTLSRRHG